MSVRDFGVDVVDLRNPRTRGRHLNERFMARVFTAAERAAIESSADRNLAVWCRWAAKEAGFKAIGIRRHPSGPPPFVHAAFETADVGDSRGRLRWEDNEFDVLFDVDPGGRWAAALAVPGDPGPEVEWTVADAEETAIRLGARGPDDLEGRLGPHERRAARGFTHGLARLAARTALARQLDVAIDRLEVVNAPGPVGRTPPLVHLDGSLLDHARVSLSHDGSIAAWATGVFRERTDGS